jgi:hypothetical protein
MDLAWKMAAMDTGKSAEVARAMVEPRIRELNQEVDLRAYTAIAAGTFTADLALQMFMEKYGYWRMMTKLVHQQRRGKAAAEALKPLLDGKQEGEAQDGQEA